MPGCGPKNKTEQTNKQKKNTAPNSGLSDSKIILLASGIYTQMVAFEKTRGEPSQVPAPSEMFPSAAAYAHFTLPGIHTALSSCISRVGYLWFPQLCHMGSLKLPKEKCRTFASQAHVFALLDPQSIWHRIRHIMANRSFWWRLYRKSKNLKKKKKNRSTIEKYLGNLCVPNSHPLSMLPLSSQ